MGAPPGRLRSTAVLPGHFQRSLGFAVCFPMLRNFASGPEIRLPGRISAEFWSGKPQNRPSPLPPVGRATDFGVFPRRVRPKSGPEARFLTRKHYRVT
jgi:hypothetical protein